MSDDDDDGADPAGGELSFAPTAWHGRTLDDLMSAPKGMPVGNSEDLERVLRLPRRPPVEKDTATAEAIIELEMQRYSRGPRKCRCAEIDRDVARGARTCITRLLWIQAWALREARLHQGLIANIPVGAGKTALNLLIPLALTDCPVVLLLIPPSLVGQLKNDYLLIAEHFRVPRITMHLPGRKTWPATQHPNAEPGVTLHVLPYSKLSGTANSTWIENLRPNAIIADEVDALKEISSSRTARVLRFFHQFHASTKFCGWTGSLTNSSVREFAHLMLLALREGSPLPKKKSTIDEWSRCLDAVPFPCPPGALTRFLDPGESEDQMRRAFGRRMAETPGCILVEGRNVITTADGREVTLDIREKQTPELPAKVLEALDKVRNWTRPDTMGGAKRDEIIGDPLEQAKCVRQVATGMFYKWKFPPINGVEQDLGLIDAWYGARKAWNAELREKVMRGEAQLDSAKLCENAAKRAWRDPDEERNDTLPEWRADNWPAWRDMKDRVKYEKEAVRIDGFLVEDATEWALKNRGIVWYGMREFAVWMHEMSKGRLPNYGQGSGEEIVEKEDGSRSILASIRSHGRGRNGLQFNFHDQLIANTMASARWWQQLLGRLVRRGQRSPIVNTSVYLHTPELKNTFTQGLRCGDYIQQFMKEDQMLLDGWQGFDNDDFDDED